MDARSDSWRTDLVEEGLTLEVAPDLAVAAVHAAGAVGATGVGAPGVVPDPTPGLVPIATRDVVIPAPDPEENQAKANHVLATAGPAHDPANPSLARALVNPSPVQLSENPAQRAVRSRSQSGILVVDPRRWWQTRSPAAVQLPQWRTERRSVPPSPPPAPRHRRRTSADQSQERSVQPLAPSPVQGLAHGLDQLLRMSEAGGFLIELDPSAVHTELCRRSGLCFPPRLLFSLRCALKQELYCDT